MNSWVDKALATRGLRLTPTWRDLLPEFHYRGRRYPGFIHAHNCGWPPAAMTERMVELAIANAWLDEQSGEVIEVGAVTPYYWPARVKRIVDPVDDHSRVTDRASLFDVDFTGKTVLSLSTLEHVGQDDYGLATFNDGPARALAHFQRAAHYLITVPYGMFEAADRAFFEKPLPEAVYMARQPGTNIWHEVPLAEARLPYGGGEHSRANGLAVLER